VIFLRASLLKSLDLQHKSTVIDPPYLPSCASMTPTGSTFWTSTLPPSFVEIRWRWAELRTAIVLLEPDLIETNLSLLGPTGSEEPRLRALTYIVEYVETLPWRTPVRRLLIASRH
jgi:hypothetical protein